MMKDIKTIVGTKIVHEETGDTLGFLNLPIINPDTGVIEAFWVKPASITIGASILQTSDILSFKKNIYIRSRDRITDPSDVIRITEILDDGRRFMGSSVKSEKGNVYGHVYNVTFSTETYVIRQIYAKRSVLGLLNYKRRIFAYDSVIKVLPGEIIINDDSSVKKGVIDTSAQMAEG